MPRVAYKAKWLEEAARHEYHKDRAERFATELHRVRGVMAAVARDLVVPMLDSSLLADPKPERIQLDPIFYECAVAFIITNARYSTDLDLVPRGMYLWKGVPLVCR